MNRCDCTDDHCEHWAERERRFRERINATLSFPLIRYCPECFQTLSRCECAS